ncbi:hypothetical protein BIV57_02855 [Mangrovactinospora gilvigrisea]|uniref:Clp R domain-containing protein n=1 Tax=Mangrovactinospora gilvigrisea TaxID=1428644 RepID=A0A1J7CBM8_9ACTN|nr:Clp protease N-terminal domain-containing protein [Mangrovactinospora gilvigrisea]OIV38924.1 hypothetical protein BIV57_02855 [Mangrovactinospora gilvigrisea]
MPFAGIRESRAAVRAALQEVRARGDRRIGTEHLLIGVLQDPLLAKAFGREPAEARELLEALDREALGVIGLDAAGLPARPVALSRKRTPLTSGARAAFHRANRHPECGAAALLLALLSCQAPDPAAELTDRLGVDRAAVRRTLLADVGDPG